MTRSRTGKTAKRLLSPLGVPTLIRYRDLLLLFFHEDEGFAEPALIHSKRADTWVLGVLITIGVLLEESIKACPMRFT